MPTHGCAVRRHATQQGFRNLRLNKWMDAKHARLHRRCERLLLCRLVKEYIAANSQASSVRRGAPVGWQR